MKKNIGKKDRIVRFVIFCVLIGAALYLKSPFLYFGALFVLYETLAGWCAFYQLIGKNTCPISQTSREKSTRILLRGYRILLVAITLNIVGSYVGLASWYSVFTEGLSSISFIDYVYLLVIYPFFLGLSAS